jgi:hypothetical protein
VSIGVAVGAHRLSAPLLKKGEDLPVGPASKPVVEEIERGVQPGHQEGIESLSPAPGPRRKPIGIESTRVLK